MCLLLLFFTTLQYTTRTLFLEIPNEPGPTNILTTGHILSKYRLGIAIKNINQDTNNLRKLKYIPKTAHEVITCFQLTTTPNQII